MSPSTGEGAFRSAKRACYAGLDSVSLRRELARRISSAIPMEAYSFSITDPDTGLMTHAVGEGISPGLMRAYLERVYPYEDALRYLDTVRCGEAVVSVADRSHLFREVLREEGYEHEINTLAATTDTLWGSFCMLREAGAAPFAPGDSAFLRRLAPHIARGLRTAVLLDLSTAGEGTPEGGRGREPGVLVLDARTRVWLKTPAAAEYLDDLADVGMGTLEVPSAVVSALVRLRSRCTGVLADEAPADAELRVRGRSGVWYGLRAALAEPDAWGCSSTVVVVEPLTQRELAPVLIRLYGLSEREREVLAGVIRGESTKRIAARLGLSAYTVQDHLGHACEKVGVRGRKALVARLFFEGYAPRLAG